MGDRTNARFCRVYDKGVEQGLYEAGWLWRLEVETKRTLAPALWKDLLRASDVSRWCLESCAQQWKSAGCYWPRTDLCHARRGISVPAEREPDSVRTARWVKTSVAPAVERLLRKYSRDDVLRMLSLETPDADAEATPRDR